MDVRIIWHSNIFSETATGIKDALFLMGIDADGDILSDRCCEFEEAYPNNKNTLFIILGIHRSTPKLPSNYIAVQMEQPGSKWFSQDYFDKLSCARAVWDFSPRNVHYLRNEGLTNVYLVPTRVPMRSYVLETIDKKQDIDVLFYGANHPRRKAIEDSLKKSKLNVVFRYYSLFDSDRDALISRAKVVLNIHFWTESSLETHRIEYLCSKGKCVISEYSKDPDLDNIYKESIVFCGYNAMVKQVHRYCRNFKIRKEMEYNAYHTSMKRQLDTNHILNSLVLIRPCI